MGKIADANKITSREHVEKRLEKLTKKLKPIDLDKYAGKVNFGIDGLEYQLKSRDEWQ